ncbi:MAG TPA: ATP synthase F1 subunit epsilon [Candidatus Saccharimonadia bacterium]|nr:ATP synthase F1 subunit epsilon [Candidatus Saccharimonadia bacterium]
MIRFKLITLSGIKFDEDVYEVLLPTLDGEIGVLTGHMPLISVAILGIISIRRDSKDPDSRLEHFACQGGVIEIKDDILQVIVGEADNADEINEKEAKAAYERAQKLKANSKSDIELEEATSLIDLLALKIKVAELRRSQNRR